MNEHHLRDAIEEFRISKAVKDAKLTESDIFRYILRVLSQSFRTVLEGLPEQQALNLSQGYYKDAVGRFSDLQHISGILRASEGGTSQLLD